MSFAPMVLAENFFNDVTNFPDHAVSANEEASKHQALRVGNGRRSTGDYWTPTTANHDAYLQVVCDRVRAATCIVIDRGHNLVGKTIALTCSNDNFSTVETVFSITMPSYCSPGSVDGPYGVRTEEGAWIRRFPIRCAKYWRLTVTAGGSGYLPQIVGLYLGLAWALPTPRFPWNEERDEAGWDESVSNVLWVGTSTIANRRVGSLPLFLPDEQSYDYARLWLHGFYRQRNPAWLVLDDAQADRAFCIIRPKNVTGWDYNDNWTNKRQNPAFDFAEHEALVA